MIIFGATGSVGMLVVQQALSMGYKVTAFIRSPEKLKQLGNQENLRLVQGDVLDSAAVEKAIIGHDSVICTLGAGRKGQLRSAGTLNIIRAMEKHGIKRLICQSTLGAGDSRPTLNFFWKYIMFGWFLKEAYRDHEGQETHVLQSQLDWTIVRPAAFTNGKQTMEYRHGFSADSKGLQLKISRADLASFLLDQLNTNEYLKKTPGISY